MPSLVSSTNHKLDDVAGNNPPLVITMAGDKGYLIPMLVAVDSMLEHTQADAGVEFYFIAPKEQHELFSEAFGPIFTHHQARRPHFLSVGAEYDKAKINTSHITTPTYYRLALPELLPYVDKCLYIDGDVIACDDLMKIVETLTANDLVSGVRAAGYYWPEENREQHRECLGLPEFTDYLNAGVLAMNLRLMRELNCTEAFHSLLSSNFPSQDQDVINKVCHGRAHILPPRFNLMTKYRPDLGDSYESIPCLRECYTEEEWREAREQPTVIHFADSIKPWQNNKMPLADTWWEAAERTSGHSDLLMTVLPLMRRTADVLVDKERIISKKNGECDILKQQLSEEKSRNKRFVQDHARVVAERDQLRTERNSLNGSLNESRKRESALRQRLKKAKSKLAKANQTIQDIHNSRSWKIGQALTAPLRWLKRVTRLPFRTRHG